MQRLFIIMWPHWIPRSVMLEVKQLIEAYFQEDYQWTHPMVRGDSNG